MRKRFPPPPDLDDPPEPSEDDRVRAWREHCFVDLGFTVDDAVTLADGPAGWERAKALLDRDCPHSLVVAILA